MQVQVLTIASGPIRFEPRAAMEDLRPRLTTYIDGGDWTNLVMTLCIYRGHDGQIK